MATHQTENVSYFAYGSNMSRERLAKHLKANPNAFGFGQRVCALGWDLRFNKPKRDSSAAANIEKRQNSIVFGVLYSLSNKQWKALKNSEGKGYKEIPFEVLNGSAVVSCLTLQAVRTKRGIKPSAEYLNTIVQGAREHGVSEDYVARVVAKAGKLGQNPKDKAGTLQRVSSGHGFSRAVRPRKRKRL